MKRFLAGILVLAAVLFSGCAVVKQGGYASPEALAEAYLKAVETENYAAIEKMLPAEIRSYGREYVKAEGMTTAQFIEYAIDDYYWLQKADLANRRYAFTIVTEEYTDPGELSSVADYFRRKGVDLQPEAVGGALAELRFADGSVVEGSFYMIKARGSWYLTSVVGDDEIFTY